MSADILEAFGPLVTEQTGATQRQTMITLHILRRGKQTRRKEATMSFDNGVPPDSPHTPAGWYQDPHTAGGLRYWDGQGWTEHAAAAQTPALAPPAPKRNLMPLWITGGALGTAFFLLIAVAIIVGPSQDTTGSSDTAPPPPSAAAVTGTMPAIVGQKLDLATANLEALGVQSSDIKIDGGGTLGVVNRSAWTVCTQVPAPGEPIANVQLGVDRTCPTPEPVPVAPAPATTAPSEPAQAAPAKPKAPKEIKVPNGVGKNYQQAQDRWRAAGLVVLPAIDATGANRLPFLDSGWVVLSQNPEAGAKVKPGSSITATVKKYTDR